MSSILIKNGLIYDGKEQPPYKNSILIRKKFFSDITTATSVKTEQIIDATGCIVTPGFIDANSAIDHHRHLFDDPHQNHSLSQGITTAIGGHSGISLAPFSTNADSAINVDWHSFSEFLSSLERKGLGINFGSLVGYSTIKRFAQNDDWKIITKLINESLSGGALGLSVNFEEVNLSPEISLRLSEIVSKKDCVYSADLHGNADKIQKTLDVLLQNKTINLFLNNLQPRKALIGEYKKLLQVINDRKSDRNIDFGSCPVPIIKLSIKNILPKNVIDKKTVLESLKKIVRKKIYFSHLPKNLNFFENKSLEEISTNHNKTQTEMLFEILQLSNMEGTYLYEDINENALQESLRLEAAIVSSNGLYLEQEDLQPLQNFLRNIYIKGDFPFEKAIAKITRNPAKKFKIKNRGIIQKGLCADLVVMNKDMDIKHVIVNGTLAVKDGQHQNTLSGNII